jgi:hypothetical protein
MSNQFHVGQRVVYVGHKSHGKFKGYQYPEAGKVYTVRQIGPSNLDVILLFGICNSKPFELYEPGFHYSGFRPVIVPKTDISIFTDMLKTQRTRISA